MVAGERGVCNPGWRLAGACVTFHDPAGFAFIAEIVSRWRLIRQEYIELQAPVLGLHRIGAADLYAETLLRENGWTPSWQVGSDAPNADWLTYALCYKGLLPDGLAGLMPATARLMARLRGVEVCALSLMRPRSFIAPHAHPELRGRMLTLHVGLMAAAGLSWMCVAGEMRAQTEGGALVFDGSLDHFSVNMADADRVVLYAEFDPNTASLAETA